MEKPRLVTASEADWAVEPTTAAGAFMAKYRPWSRMDAAIMAMTATNDSVSLDSRCPGQPLFGMTVVWFPCAPPKPGKAPNPPWAAITPVTGQPSSVRFWG